MTTQSKSLRLADSLSAEPYTWPGGYPRFAVLDDGAALCKACAKAERLVIATTTGNDGWCIKRLAINFDDPDLICSHCGDQIPAAYC
jgi:hypothetical protein